MKLLKGIVLTILGLIAILYITGSNSAIDVHIHEWFIEFVELCYKVVEQEYDELNMAIKYFQDTMMRMRYSSIPTIACIPLPFLGFLEDFKTPITP